MPRPDSGRPAVTSIAVDFTGVETRKGGGKAIRVTPGDYLLEVTEAVVKEKQGAGTKYINWTMGIVRGPEVKRGPLYHITSLKPEQLWSLKGFLQDLLGKEVNQGPVKLNLANYKGKQIGATLEDDEPYTKVDPNTGKEVTTIKSRIAFTFPAADFKEAGEVPSDDDDDEDSDDAQEVDATESSEDDEDELDTIDEDEI